jgi:hypothetical protein
MGKVIAAHAVVLLEVADDGLNGRASSHVAFYLRGDAALLRLRLARLNCLA